MWAGECLTKSTDPNRIGLSWVGELPLTHGWAEEISNPTPQFPTDGANVEGATSTIPIWMEIRGFVKEEGVDGLLGYAKG